MDLEEALALAGHDLREPLRTVTSFTQLLAREVKGKVNADADQYLAFILDGTARMRATVDGLQALSAAAGPGSEMRLVSCGEIVAECVRGLPGTIEVGELPEIRADAAQMALLFQNLLANAVRFRKPEGDLHIEVSAEKLDGNWQFCVRDNGIGFNPAQAQSLFVPFRRLHSRAVSGAGIGLAICRKIVERHGGWIWAEAKEGEGAAFRFTLS